jgi:hypothetical protein
VVFDALWDGGNIEITGNATGTGSDETEVIAAAPGTTVQGGKAFTYIRRVRNLGARTAGTADVQTGIALGIERQGLTVTRIDAYELSALGRDAGGGISPLGAVTWTDVPNGVRDFWVSYSLDVASNDSGHGHGAGTFAGPSHDHTGPSHDHAAGTYAGPSHDHGVGTIADSGHDHGPGTHTHSTTPDAHAIA